MAILGYCSIINMLVLYTIRAIDGTCKTDQKKRYKLNICKYFFVRYGLSTKKGDKKGIVDEYNHSTISQKALIMQILNYAYWLICLVIIIIDAINPNIVPLKVQFIIILIYFSMWVVLLIYGLVIETISEIKLSKE